MKFIDWFYLAAISLFTLIPSSFLIYKGFKQGGGKVFRDCWKKRIKYKTWLGTALALSWAFVVHYTFALPASTSEIPMVYKFATFSIPLKVEWGTVILAVAVFILLGSAAINYYFDYRSKPKA